MYLSLGNIRRRSIVCRKRATVRGKRDNDVKQCC